MKQLLLRYPVTGFLLITFMYTYSIWFLPVLIDLPADLAFTTNILGGAGPLLAAWILSALRSGVRLQIGSMKLFVFFFLFAAFVLLMRLYFSEQLNNTVTVPGLQQISWASIPVLAAVFFIVGFNASQATNIRLQENYIRSFLFSGAAVKWYLIAFGIIPFIYLSSYMLGVVFSLPLSDYIFKGSPLIIFSFFTTLLMTGGNEEFGWRGFMQKEMQKTYNPLVVAFIISFFWSLWHLPLHYNGIYSTGGYQDLLPRFVWLLPITIGFTWLYNRSSYSMLAVCILHAVLNTSVNRLGYSATLTWIIFGLVILFCIVEGKMWKRRDYHTAAYGTENVK